MQHRTIPRTRSGFTFVEFAAVTLLVVSGALSAVSSATRPSPARASAVAAADDDWDPTPPPLASALDDTAETVYMTPVTVDVLANDGASTEAPIDPSTLWVSAPPLHGEALVTGDGRIRYTSRERFSAVDHFTYHVATTAGDLTTATVTVTVLPPPMPAPSAAEDVYRIERDRVPTSMGAQVDVLHNDEYTDLPGAPAVLLISSVSGGEATVTPERLVSYSGDPSGSFTYQVCDLGGCDSTTAQFVFTLTAAEPTDPTEPPASPSPQQSPTSERIAPAEAPTPAPPARIYPAEPASPDQLGAETGSGPANTSETAAATAPGPSGSPAPAATPAAAARPMVEDGTPGEQPGPNQALLVAAAFVFAAAGLTTSAFVSRHLRRR